MTLGFPEGHFSYIIYYVQNRRPKKADLTKKLIGALISLHVTYSSGNGSQIRLMNLQKKKAPPRLLFIYNRPSRSKMQRND